MLKQLKCFSHTHSVPLVLGVMSQLCLCLWSTLEELGARSPSTGRHRALVVG